jgi:hypothetical protein
VETSLRTEKTGEFFSLKMNKIPNNLLEKNAEIDADVAAIFVHFYCKR